MGSSPVDSQIVDALMEFADASFIENEFDKFISFLRDRHEYDKILEIFPETQGDFCLISGKTTLDEYMSSLVDPDSQYEDMDDLLEMVE